MMDSDSDIDITASLLPSNNAANESDLEEDAVFASLKSLSRSKNLAEGTAVVKQRKDLKGKQGLVGGGSFQSLGLPPSLLKALLQRGFTTPTPIQRAALPSILGSTETIVGGKKMTVARDHVCMARTGSGKTLCYLLPMLAQLLAHSSTFGARALILVPTRELALQVLKVGKDLARAVRGEGEQLRWAMIVGGDGMEEQFSMMAGNPDIIIATPGRLLHLIVEMSMELKAIQYCVFDEADRLFELGFSEQLHEILHRMPPTRQTLLFSATLPSSIVGFAKAGLTNPKLIRLDADSKISKDLQMSYFSIKPSEKEAALFGLLREIIDVPLMTDEQRRFAEAQDNEEEEVDYNKRKPQGKPYNKRKRDFKEPEPTVENQTVIFVCTKHHVEYISLLLTHAGYAVSSIYGSMDQTARRIHLSRFRAGHTNILVVTDLAARGIDVPGVESVINYDFPNGPRAFIHRVGRTARAGRKGWAYTLVTSNDLPHLLDLELFLTRPIKTCPLAEGSEPDYANQLILGTFPRSLIDLDIESVRTLYTNFTQLPILSGVAIKGQKMYERGLGKASAESYRRAKELERRGNGLAINSGVSHGEHANTHAIFQPFLERTVGNIAMEQKRADLMKIVNGFTPTETVFEIGTRGKTVSAQLMHSRRKAMEKSHRARKLEDDEDDDVQLETKEDEMSVDTRPPIEDADQRDIEEVFGAQRKKRKVAENSYQDPQFYMGYEQEGAHTEQGYSLASGQSFVAQAAQSQYDITGRGDTEGTPAEALTQRASTLKWDRKTKKFVRSTVGADNKKMIKSESGRKLPASFRSGVYDDWQKKERVKIPRVGDDEIKGRSIATKKYRHNSGTPNNGDDEGAAEKSKGKGKSKNAPKRTVGKAGKPGSMAGGLKSVAEIRKDRVSKAKRVARSTQPGKKNKGKK